MDARQVGGGAAVTHLQAFHTSCRTGLGGTSGFQVNAASPQLDREQLASLSDAHARYETPNDLPYEPTPEQMRTFPVSLKMSIVPSLGPVVSRTEYVGREYRGRDGSPDEGRFGNYFCHMVVGTPGADPFDGLHAVELWGARHWTTAESIDPALPALGPLAPGPLALPEVLGVVMAASPGVAAALLDGTLGAVGGGSPLLIVDPVAGRPATWLAWISFALPADIARGMTFSTFEGRPQDVQDLQVVATTPACESGTGLHSRFARVDVTTSVDTPPSLYARAALALAEQGAEALATAVRKVRGTSTVDVGARLAIAGGVTHLVGDDDLPGMLRQLRDLVAAGRVAEAAEAVTALEASPAGDRRTIREWADLYVAARGSTAGDAARDLASATLARLVSHLDALPDDLPRVRSDAPAAPSVGSIAAWLRATEAAAGTDASGRLFIQGLELGLLGLNVPVDTRAAAVVVQDLDRPSMTAALDAVDADGANDHIIKAVTDAVAAEPGSQQPGRVRLMALCRYEMARQTIRRRAEELQTFDAQAAWQQVRVAFDPGTLPAAARTLAAITHDQWDEAEVRRLWGEHGPRTEVDLDVLLRAYIEAGRPVPRADIDRAVAALMAAPLPAGRPERTSIANALSEASPEARKMPAYCAWWVACNRPGPDGTTLERWCRRAVTALDASARDIPDERWLELVAVVAETLMRERCDAGFKAALEMFAGPQKTRLYDELGNELAKLVETAPDRAAFAAREYQLWIYLPDPELDETVLLTGFQKLTNRDVEDVGEALPEHLHDHWKQWAENHPRTGPRAAVARVFSRRGKDRDGDDR